MKKICFDLDNVICKTRGNNYKEAIPYKNVIKFINNLYSRNFFIIIFTARYMGRFDEDVNKVKKYGLAKTRKQLKKWKINYHKLVMGKPSYDYFVDDKAIGFKKNWMLNFKSILKT